MWICSCFFLVTCFSWRFLTRNLPTVLVCHLLSPSVPSCAGCPREEHTLNLEMLFVSSLQLSAIAGGELVLEIAPYSSSPRFWLWAGSDRPVEGGDITLPLPRVPVQSGANWFEKNLHKPEGIKNIFWNCFILTHPLSFCFPGGQFYRLLDRSFSYCQRKLCTHDPLKKNPKKNPKPTLQNPQTPRSYENGGNGSFNTVWFWLFKEVLSSLLALTGF